MIFVYCVKYKIVYSALFVTDNNWTIELEFKVILHSYYSVKSGFVSPVV